jgi:hypothetical protein
VYALWQICGRFHQSSIETRHAEHDTFCVNRRSISALLIVLVSIPVAAFFVVMPQWQIEHPGDSSLVLRAERHWLWQAPAHAHLDAAAIVIPVLAISIVAIALMVVALYRE